MKEERRFRELIKEVPVEFQENIRDAKESLNEAYTIFQHKMPVPPWKRDGFDDVGLQVWENIQRNIKSSNAGHSISIYIHIPFCIGEKCGFCDCLSVPVYESIPMDPHTPMMQFVTALVHEIRLWSEIPELKDKPVSVIYFGGGTPNSMPDKDFKRVCFEIANRFNVNSHTQISVECTGRGLTSERLDLLESLKVDRLSVGIQTLEEPLRNRIGRKLSAPQILKVLKNCREKEFTVSGDLLYGLPSQTIDGYVQSIKTLIDASVEGLSLYRFSVTERNRDFVQSTFPDYLNDEVLNYLLFHMGHQLLSEAGYKKNHFIHFAKKDDNRYYRHVLRGEDLIAFGPTSDGCVGNYRYRHPHVKEYLNGKNSSIPTFEGGMLESDIVATIRSAIAQIMSNEIDYSTFLDLDLEGQFNKWATHRLIERTNDHLYQLTANGSWLVDQLLFEMGRPL